MVIRLEIGIKLIGAFLQIFQGYSDIILIDIRAQKEKFYKKFLFSNLNCARNTKYNICHE